MISADISFCVFGSYNSVSLKNNLLFLCLWFHWVLWHINHCRLFNAKSSLYIYIKYIAFGFVGFYGISTIVGYLFPNQLYTCISNYGLVGFYGISIIIGYLMPNPFYTHVY